jgi:Tetratricopeptide repeat
MVREYGILLAHDLTNNYPMKTNKYILVDLLLLGLTIVLMIVFHVVFYPIDQSTTPGKETISKELIFKEVLIYKNSGDLDAALTLCNKVVSDNKSNARGYYLRAVIYAGLGRNDDAINDYSKAVKLNPDFFQAYLDRGLLSLKEKQPLKALLDFVSAIKINPLKSSSFLISRSFKSII